MPAAIDTTPRASERADQPDAVSPARRSSRRPPRTSAGQRGPDPGASLAVALLGFFIVTLDAMVVNVALPAVSRDLHGGLTGLQWVVDGYTVDFA